MGSVIRCTLLHRSAIKHNFACLGVEWSFDLGFIGSAAFWSCTGAVLAVCKQAAAGGCAFKSVQCLYGRIVFSTSFSPPLHGTHVTNRFFSHETHGLPGRKPIKHRSWEIVYAWVLLYILDPAVERWYQNVSITWAPPRGVTKNAYKM